MKSKFKLGERCQWMDFSVYPKGKPTYARITGISLIPRLETSYQISIGYDKSWVLESELIQLKESEGEIVKGEWYQVGDKVTDKKNRNEWRVRGLTKYKNQAMEYLLENNGAYFWAKETEMIPVPKKVV